MRFVTVLAACVSSCASTTIGPGAAVYPDEWTSPNTVERCTSEGSPVTLSDLVVEPLLRDLVKDVLEQNLSLHAAAARVREVEARLAIEESALGPSGDVTVGTGRQGTGTSSRSDLTLGLRLGWEADVWGRFSAQREAAAADYDAEVFEYAAARNALAAQALLLALEYVYRVQVVALEERRVASLGANEEVIRVRFRRGIGQLSDWEAAEVAATLAAADLFRQRDALERVGRTLSLLRGDIRLTPPKLPSELPEVSAPELDIPASDLARRPDLAAALKRVDAAAHRAGAARRALLPRFSIEAVVDTGGSTLREALETDPVWALLANLTAPLLDGGRRAAEVDALDEQRRAIWDDYRTLLLEAVVEVENAVGTDRALRDRLEKAQRGQELAAQSRRTFEERYNRGLADIIDLLAVQRQEFDAELGVLETSFLLRRNRIELALAIGIGAHS